MDRIITYYGVKPTLQYSQVLELVDNAHEGSRAAVR